MEKKKKKEFECKNGTIRSHTSVNGNSDEVTVFGAFQKILLGRVDPCFPFPLQPPPFFWELGTSKVSWLK